MLCLLSISRWVPLASWQCLLAVACILGCHFAFREELQSAKLIVSRAPIVADTRLPIHNIKERSNLTGVTPVAHRMKHLLAAHEFFHPKDELVMVAVLKFLLDRLPVRRRIQHHAQILGCTA